MNDIFSGLTFSIYDRSNGIREHRCHKLLSDGTAARTTAPSWFKRLPHDLTHVTGKPSFGRCTGHYNSWCVCFRQPDNVSPWSNSQQVVYCSICLSITCSECMKRVVIDFSESIQRRNTRGIPLEATTNGEMFLNVCRSCIISSTMNEITLLDHPHVKISNVFNIDEEADRLALHHGVGT